MTADLCFFVAVRRLDDIDKYVARAYGAGSLGEHQGMTGPLPLEVARPGRLMAHAVHLAGSEGITRQGLRDLFHRLGQDRFDEGLRSMRLDDTTTETKEHRPNSAGRSQQQVVFRCDGSPECLAPDDDR